MFELLIVALFKERKFFTQWLPSASTSVILLLLLHGFLAFLLNIANFQAVKEGGPLMMNVVGNVKQVVMVMLSVYLFNQKMKTIGIVGSMIAIGGSFWYSLGRRWSCVLGVENGKQRRRMKMKSEKNV